MASPETYRQYGEELEKRLRLMSLPVAVKMVVDEADIPAGAKRPVRDLGYHLSLCQAWALARRNGRTVALTKEDNWCFYPVITLGFEEPPAFFLEGKSIPPGTKTPEGCRGWSEAFPRLPLKKYKGIVFAPLKATTFEPDLVLIYCDSLRLLYLMMGLSYKNGRDITSRINNSAVCGYSIAPALLSGECQVSVPCGGDRRFASAQDDELVLSVPLAKLDELMFGIRTLDDAGRLFPQTVLLTVEPRMPPTYVETARLLGM